MRLPPRRRGETRLFITRARGHHHAGSSPSGRGYGHPPDHSPVEGGRPELVPSTQLPVGAFVRRLVLNDARAAQRDRQGLHHPAALTIRPAGGLSGRGSPFRCFAGRSRMVRITSAPAHHQHKCQHKASISWVICLETTSKRKPLNRLLGHLIGGNFDPGAAFNLP